MPNVRLAGLFPSGTQRQDHAVHVLEAKSRVSVVLVFFKEPLDVHHDVGIATLLDPLACRLVEVPLNEVDVGPVAGRTAGEQAVSID